MPKLTKDLLKKLIIEEVGRLSEGAEEDAIAKLTKASSDLVSSMEKFQEFIESSPLVKSAVMQHFDPLLNTVKEFSKNPSKFVKIDEPAKVKRTVVLKPVSPTKKVV